MGGADFRPPSFHLKDGEDQRGEVRTQNFQRASAAPRPSGGGRPGGGISRPSSSGGGSRGGADGGISRPAAGGGGVVVHVVAAEVAADGVSENRYEFNPRPRQFELSNRLDCRGGLQNL